MVRLSDKQYDVRIQISKIITDLELRLSLKQFGSFLHLLKGELLFLIKPVSKNNDDYDGNIATNISSNNNKTLSIFEQKGVFNGFRVNEFSIRKEFKNMSA